MIIKFDKFFPAKITLSGEISSINLMKTKTSQYILLSEFNNLKDYSIQQQINQTKIDTFILVVDNNTKESIKIDLVFTNVGITY